jgi:hypothetical protein
MGRCPDKSIAGLQSAATACMHMGRRPVDRSKQRKTLGRSPSNRQGLRVQSVARGARVWVLWGALILVCADKTPEERGFKGFLESGQEGAQLRNRTPRGSHTHGLIEYCQGASKGMVSLERF